MAHASLGALFRVCHTTYLHQVREACLLVVALMTCYENVQCSFQF